MTQARALSKTPRRGAEPALSAILVVEDDQVAATLIRRHLELVGLANPVIVVTDGDRAVEWLRARAVGGAEQLPALIVLDQHLPGRTGIEVLRWVHAQPSLRRVPVLMLTSESDVGGISEAYALGARSYLIKPVGFDALDDVVRGLELRWAILPPGDQPR